MNDGVEYSVDHVSVKHIISILFRVIMGVCWGSGLVTVLVGGCKHAEELIDGRVIIGELLGCECIGDG